MIYFIRKFQGGKTDSQEILINACRLSEFTIFLIWIINLLIIRTKLKQSSYTDN